MNPENHDRVGDLFLRALDLPTEERERFLDEECRDEPDLRARVEAMVRHDRRPPGALKTGGFRPPGFGEAAPLPDRMGVYEIVELIGEGGMGVVYRAVQSSPIRRQVAVKIILPGFETRRVVARFESEREALARMDHPNIAQVVDAGTTDAGRPYFVMEFVDGEPITDYCDRRDLTLDRRLELFLDVCAGVQHAHQNAILHRDLKPSNILVTERDGKPTPKIIDFGVAKALGETDPSSAPVTDAGRPVGTPGYISPEQAAVNGRGIDTRTDVYSLGVLLYELLVGAQPFNSEQLGHVDPDRFRRVILEHEPSPPSSRVRALADPAIAKRRGIELKGHVSRLAGDLDWIVLKALQKEPDRRYSTPSALAADIRRYLRHEPVLAGPPGALYRARKFIRRHRAAVAIGAATAITIAVFAATAFRQANVAKREARRARQEAETVQALTEFLVSDLFQVSHSIGPRVDRLSAGDLVSQSTENALQELADRPLLRARMQHTLGNVHRRMGLDDRALPLLEEACAGLAAHSGSSDSNALRCASDLARVHLNLRQFEEAERLYTAVLAERRVAAVDDAPDTLRAMNDLAYLYMAWDRNEQAVSLFEEAVAGLRRDFGEDDPETLIAAGFLAGAYLELGRFDELEPLLLELTAKAPEVLGPYHLETHAAWYNLGCLHARRGEQEQALEFLKMAIDRGFNSGTALSADPHLASLLDDPRFKSLARAAANNVASAWAAVNRRGEAAVADGDLAGAAALFSEVVDASRRRLDSRQHVEVRTAMDYLAFIHLTQWRYVEAEPLLLKLLQLNREVPLVGAPPNNYVLWNLARCDVAAGRTEQALERIAQARSTCPGWGVTFTCAYLEAVERSIRGDRRGALDLLNRAADLGRSEAFLPDSDPAFDSLRGDPEFDKIVERMSRGELAE